MGVNVSRNHANIRKGSRCEESVDGGSTGAAANANVFWVRGRLGQEMERSRTNMSIPVINSFACGSEGYDDISSIHKTYSSLETGSGVSQQL